MQRVLERRRQDAVPFLVLVAVHSAAAACVAAAHALRNQPFEHKINAEARGKRHSQLDAEDQRQRPPVFRVCDEQRHRLVGRGKEHRQQGTQRDHLAGVQVCRHGRKTALGQQAQYGARHKAKAPAARQCFFDALRVAVLHIFDQPVRREQKGQHFHAVQQRVQ